MMVGQHLSYHVAAARLRHLGFPLGQARVEILRQLVLEAPAPVVAEALGLHHTSITRQVANAGGRWNAMSPPSV